MEADVLKAIRINTEVTIIEKTGEWYKIKVGDITGYVAERLLSDEKVEVTSRSLPKEQPTKKENNNDIAEEEQLNNISKGEEVVNLAKSYLKYPYTYGGTTPSKGFDCSGFTMYIYKQFGVSLSHSATAQSKVGTYISKESLQLGDLVIFNDDANRAIGHVGIYIGENNFIHASNPSDGVKITSLQSSYYSKRYVTARRVL